MGRHAISAGRIVWPEKPDGQIYRWRGVDMETRHVSSESNYRLVKKTGIFDTGGLAAEGQAR